MRDLKVLKYIHSRLKDISEFVVPVMLAIRSTRDVRAYLHSASNSPVALNSFIYYYLEGRGLRSEDIIPKMAMDVDGSFLTLLRGSYPVRYGFLNLRFGDVADLIDENIYVDAVALAINISEMVASVKIIDEYFETASWLARSNDLGDPWRRVAEAMEMKDKANVDVKWLDGVEFKVVDAVQDFVKMVEAIKSVPTVYMHYPYIVITVPVHDTLKSVDEVLSEE